MIDQAVFEEICQTEIVNLEQTITTGKTQNPSTTKTGLKLFLQPKDGDLSIGVVAGVSFTGYLFTNQLQGTLIKQNDKLKIGNIYYEVVSDGQLMNQNLDYEPFYQLDLQKRIRAN
jgi:hypothetical protein